MYQMAYCRRSLATAEQSLKLSIRVTRETARGHMPRSYHCIRNINRGIMTRINGSRHGG